MASGTDAPSLPVRRVLVVDDSLSVQQAVREAFAATPQVEVHGCGDVAAAESFLEGQTPDLVLCDAVLPGRPGYDLCRSLTSRRRDSRPLVFLLSGAFEPFDQAAASSSGADDVISKPFRPEEIRARLAGHLMLDAVVEAEPAPENGPPEDDITAADVVAEPPAAPAVAPTDSQESATEELIRRMTPDLAGRLVEPVAARLLGELGPALLARAEEMLRRAAEEQVQRRLDELEAEAGGPPPDRD